MSTAVNCVDEKLIIETEFEDVLTSSSCTTLIAEIIKYILYHKQQLPYTFDRLKYVITKRRAIQVSKTNKKVAPTNVERLFKIAEEGFTTLEELFNRTKQELLKGEKICEIALLFGSSPLTPKQVYHIHLPDLYCDHQLGGHSDAKYLLQFLQTVIQCNQLTEMLMKPMGPTNMYVFLRKGGNYCNSDNLSSWFLPKNRFEIPPSGQHFHIKLSSSTSDIKHCDCRGFSVYSDSDTDIPNLSGKHDREDNSVKSQEKKTEWYQACTTFRGFKDVFLNGVSVSDLWIRFGSMASYEPTVTGGLPNKNTGFNGKGTVISNPTE